MLRRIAAWIARHPGRTMWGLVAAAVVAMGLWGFRHLEPATQQLSWPEATYRTIRLFTLNLDIPDGASAPWPLWVAAFVAPLVTARGVAALFKDQLAGLVTQYFTRPSAVVFGANTHTAALIAAEPHRRWRDAIVVVDSDPVALATIARRRVRTVLGDGASPALLARAAVRHTSTVVVCTGDYLRNSTITTQVLALPVRHDRDVFVEVDGYGLASIVEQGGQPGTKPTPFSAAALAVESVFEQLESERAATGASALLAPGPQGRPATVVLFGTGTLVDAALLELYRRRRLQLVEHTGAPPAVPRIAVFGPDARQRRDSLEALLGTELQVMDVDAVEAQLGQLVELDIGTARHLVRYDCTQAIVLVPSDLDGGIAVALARHLGGTGEVIVINESPSTPIGDEIERQAADSPLMSRVRLFRMPDRAYTLATLRAERRADRLARWLPGGGRPHAERVAAARELVARAEAENVVVRRDAFASLDPPHLELLELLGLVPARAFARARLAVDVQNPDIIERAARTMLTSGSTQAFATWCEVARLRDRPEALHAGPADGPGEDAADVRDVLELRRAALEARMRAPTGAPPMIVLCAGEGDDDRADFLRVTWRFLPSEFVVWTTATACSGLARATAADGVTLRHPPGPDGRSPRRLAIDIWKAVLAAHADPATVRVLGLPGAATDEILVARTLGAVVGRVETAGTTALARVVLGGAAGIVPLPDDRMTVRAFLRKSTWPREIADPESIARELHNCYVQRQRERNVTVGPALEPWEALLPWLRESNRAVVRDVPNKLAAIGLRLTAPGHPGADPAVDLAQVMAANMALLAEQEHGRFTEERLTGGWTSGVRDPARFMSPHLKPWEEIDEAARDDDRGVLEDLFHALANKGIGAVPWTS